MAAEDIVWSCHRLSPSSSVAGSVSGSDEIRAQQPEHKIDLVAEKRCQGQGYLDPSPQYLVFLLDILTKQSHSHYSIPDTR